MAPRNYRDPAADALTRIGCAYLDTPDGQVALQRAISLAQRSRASLNLYSVSARWAERFSPPVGQDGYLLEAGAGFQEG